MKSPPTTIASASACASARTASSAHGMPWMSYSAATRICLIGVGDLDDHTPPVAGGARAHERAERARDPALAADHLADVVCRDMQHETELAVALLLLHAHGLRVVDQLAREIREQLCHLLRDALGLQELRDRFGR